MLKKTQHAFTHHTHTIADLKALYAEETEGLVQSSLSARLLRLMEVVFQVFLHLLSTAGTGGSEEGRLHFSMHE